MDNKQISEVIVLIDYACQFEIFRKSSEVNVWLIIHVNLKILERFPR